MAEAVTINRDHFNEATRHKGSDFYVDLFYDQAQLALNTLIHACETHDAIEWHDAAHKLKGAAATLGFTSTTTILNNMLDLSHAEPKKQGYAMKQLHDEVIELKRYFEKESLH